MNNTLFHLSPDLPPHLKTGFITSNDPHAHEAAAGTTSVKGDEGGNQS